MSKPIGYICGTDTTDLHIGALDIKIYPTIKDFKKHRTCWPECGILPVYAGHSLSPDKINDIEEAEAIAKMLDDKVEKWHSDKDNKQELHEYIGWTLEQYNKWVETGKVPK